MDWSWLHEYQTLVGWIVGFGGVILTLLGNAWLTRRARENARRHERQALRVALVAELEINQRSLQEELEQSEGDASTVAVPVDDMDDAYRALLPRIGLLSENEVREVMGAYLFLQEIKRRFFLIGIVRNSASQYINVLGVHLNVVVELRKQALARVEAALAALGDAMGA